MTAPAPITHYENFPVASLLCPPTLRAPIAAIYHFARTADDLADEGDATPAQRLADLQAYTVQLHIASQSTGDLDARWQTIFIPLRIVIQQYQLPIQPLADLLSAFMQDIEKTRDGIGYTDEAELLDYCRRSANPVGRLLLHLYGVHDATALQKSNAICSALQLINFWQDLSVDLPRRRYYLPRNLCLQYGVEVHAPSNPALIAHCVHAARQLMLSGQSLVHHIPGRAGWELRLVVQGGLRILDKIQAIHYNTVQSRPTLRWWDIPIMIWRACRM